MAQLREECAASMRSFAAYDFYASFHSTWYSRRICCSCWNTSTKSPRERSVSTTKALVLAYNRLHIYLRAKLRNSGCFKHAYININKSLQALPSASRRTRPPHEEARFLSGKKIVCTQPFAQCKKSEPEQLAFFEIELAG